MPFPDGSLNIVIEFAFGADPESDPAGWTWTDVTELGGDSDLSRILGDQVIEITRGRPDEGADTEPASTSFVLDNGDGFLTPDDPRSPLWPHIVEGVPCRVTVEGSHRLTGQVGSWSLEWPHGDNSPDGVVPSESRVLVEVAGILRRLGQGGKPVHSAMRRAVSRAREVTPDEFEWWPLERNLRSATGGSPVRFVSTFSPPRPSLERPSIVDAPVDAVSGALMIPEPGDYAPEGPFMVEAGVNVSNQPWSASCFIATPEFNDDDWMDIGFTAHSTDHDEAPLGAEFICVVMPDTGWIEVRYKRWQNGSEVADVWDEGPIPDGVDFSRGRLFTLSVPTNNSATLWVDDVQALSIGFPANASARQIASITLTKLDIAGQNPAWFSHLFAVHGSASAWASNAEVRGVLADGARAHVGELAADRFLRLCAEEEITASTVGVGGPLGPQRPLDVIDLLHEIAATDVGVLGEARNTLGLTYTASDARYDRDPALVLDAVANEITNPITPVRDDLDTRNDVTATSPSGDEVRVVDADHMHRSGRYETSIEANTVDQAQLAQLAHFELHRGTRPGMRYRQVSVDLTAAPHLVDDWVDVEEGDWWTVGNLPVQHPQRLTKLLAEGLTESFSHRRWSMSANTSPADVWVAGALVDEAPPDPIPDYDARLDTAGAEIFGAGISVGATGFAVESTSGFDVWVNSTDHPDEFPFDIEIGGERMTVTAISEPVDDVQVFSVTRAVNNVSKAHPAGAAVQVAEPLVLTI